MVSHVIIFIVGLVFLAKGADYFVEYAGRLAKRFGVSDFVIGLTITSIGTSIPELAASISASIQGHSGLIIGNIVGSNIANIGLILGVSALITPFKTESKLYERDGYIMIASVLLFFAFSLNNHISSIEAIVFIFGYLLYVLFLIHSRNAEKSYHFKDFMKYVFDFQYIAPLKNTFFPRTVEKQVKEQIKEEGQQLKFSRKELWKDMGVVVISCSAVAIGANYMIEEAVWIARFINVPESVIGLSIIAVGTSLPELTVSISAAQKGRAQMVVGNVVGSNIANVLLIVGMSGIILPMEVAEISVVYTIPIVLFFSLAFLYFIKSDRKIKRSQGTIAIGAYLLFMVLAFIMGWS